MSKVWQITDAWTVQNFMIWQIKIDNSHLYVYIFFWFHDFIFCVVNVQAALFQQFYIALTVQQPHQEKCK
jgi:hypothetical protein